MELYHLDLCVSGELDEQTKIVDRSVHPIIVENVGLEINDWPLDDFCTTFPVRFMAERLKSLLVYEDFSGIEFTEIVRISQGLDFIDNYKDALLPRFWKVDLNMNYPEVPISLWNNKFVVVTKDGLEFLRDNRVTHATEYKITDNVDQYFDRFINKFKIS